MKRRDFLKYLLSTPAATIIDYEKLLWVPGEKKIFLPSLDTSEWNKINNLISLYGIPYHMCTGYTGEWLGISRTIYPRLRIR